jgi:hypothetical protein
VGFFVDAMIIHFDNTIYARGKQRQKRRREKRMQQAGIKPSETSRVDTLKNAVSDNAPDQDRISRLESQIGWLREAGFSSVDHIWHFWMEHFFVCRK